MLAGRESYPFDSCYYHYFNAWTYLNGRVGSDIAITGFHTYILPYLDIFVYLLTKYLNNFPYIAAFLGGIPYGIYLFLLLKFILLISNEKKSIFNISFIAFSFLIAATGTTALLNINTSYYDCFCTIFFLLSLYLMLKEIKIKKDCINHNIFLWAGIFSGIAIAVKVPYIIFLVAFILSMRILIKKKDYYYFLIFFLLGNILMFFLIQGAWMHTLYKLYGNPIFPFANNIFHSIFIQDMFIRHDNFLPQNLYEFIFLPFLINHQKETMYGCVDYRLTLMYTLTFIYFCLELISLLPKKKKLILEEKILYSEKYFSFFIVFFIVSYILWINSTAIYRYIMPLESISGILIFCLTIRIFEFMNINQKYIVILSMFYTYFLGLTTVSNLNFRIPFDKKILYVENLNLEDNSLVMIENNSPVHFIALFQNPSVKYVGFGGYLPWYSDYTVDLIKKEVQNYDKKYILFYGENLNDGIISKLKEIGFYTEANNHRCRFVKTNLIDNKIVICE